MTDFRPREGSAGHRLRHRCFYPGSASFPSLASLPATCRRRQTLTVADIRPDTCPCDSTRVRLGALPSVVTERRYARGMTPVRHYGVIAASVLISALACGGGDDGGGSEVVGGASSAGTAGSGGSLSLDPVGGGSDVGLGGDDGAGPTSGTLPAGFTKADVGGYKLGEEITSDEGSGDAGAPSSPSDGCGTTILGVVRDFTPEHPDFEKAIASEKGLVEPILGADRKPVFAHAGATKTVSGPASFDEWYRNTEGKNMPYVLQVFFAPVDGTTRFQSNAFFPLDGGGFGNGGNPHNFHFTTEIHTQFRYNGGEVFDFTGDDDVWIFINEHLVVDLGGVHGAQNATLKVDAVADDVGIEVGSIYPFDMFHAERHTSESNFRADTNLEFVDCGTIVPDVPK